MDSPRAGFDREAVSPAPPDEAREKGQPVIETLGGRTNPVEIAIQYFRAVGESRQDLAALALLLRAESDTSLLWEVWAIAARLNTLNFSDAGRLERIERMVEKAWEPTATRAPTEALRRAYSVAYDAAARSGKNGDDADPDDAHLMRDAAGLLNLFALDEPNARETAGRLRRRADEITAAARAPGREP